MTDNSEKKLGTRVFKKCSPNGKLTIYIGKRDFLDKNGTVEPIDGVINFDKEFLKDRKLFVHILAAFHYGREDLDVLGLTFQKDLYMNTLQIYPPKDEDGVKGNSELLTKLQERLINKMGSDSVPFHFQLPHLTPASVSLQPASDHDGKPCGVEYELKAYVSDLKGNSASKRSSVSLMIRKLTYATAEAVSAPSEELMKEFKTGNGSIRLEASLDKSIYVHGEAINVNVSVDNTCNKAIKRIRIQVVQISDIMLYSRAVYKSVVDETESDDACPINPGNTGWCKIFQMCPLLSNNRNKLGIAVDGKLRHEDTNLASSTVTDENADLDNLGIIVSYVIRVRLIMGFGVSDIQLELPFMLTHPKSSDGYEAIDEVKEPENTQLQLDSVDPSSIIPSIDVDDDSILNRDDELIFEDFARMRLKEIEESEA